MELYIDPSCFLKLLFQEPETRQVLQLLEKEEKVVVSSLAKLEILTQLHRCYSAKIFEDFYRKVLALIHAFPFRPVALSSDLFLIAENQILKGGIYCKTLDRLHLAAMDELGLTRLLTNDFKQAEAARELGFEVIMPKRYEK